MRFAMRNPFYRLQWMIVLTSVVLAGMSVASGETVSAFFAEPCGYRMPWSNEFLRARTPTPAWRSTACICRRKRSTFACLGFRRRNCVTQPCACIAEEWATIVARTSCTSTSGASAIGNLHRALSAGREIRIGGLVFAGLTQQPDIPPTAAASKVTRSSIVVETSGYLLSLHELGIQSDGDFVAHQNSAGFESGVIGQTEILAADLGGRRKPNPSVAPGILRRRRWPFHCKADFSGNSVNGQIAFHGQLSLARDLDARGLEVQGGKLFNVKEISALEVRIALFIGGVKGGSFDGSFDAIVGRIRLIPDQHSRNLGEMAFNVGDHHVLDLELSRGVSRIDVPGSGGLWLSYGGAHKASLFIASISVVSISIYLISSIM